MTTPHTIPMLQVAGTHREVGEQIGDAGAEQIRRNIAASFAQPPAGRSREQQLALAAEYRALAVQQLPWLVEELEGCADGAGVDRLEFFATTLEEIWYAPHAPTSRGRCSDLVAGPAATANGHLLVAHNNDLDPDDETNIVGIEKRVPGDPVIFQLGGAPWISVGWNSFGLSLTGNELAPNDEHVGISRSHQVFEMLRAETLKEMVAAALRPDRASSYNNVLSSAHGEVVNVEGSATDAELTGLDGAGHLAHTNHYVCDRMLAFEGDPVQAVRSDVRYRRASDLLSGKPPASITMADLREMLSDHETQPDSLCRHPDPGQAGSKTVFWCVADVTEGRIAYGHGNPCESVEQEYVFADYPSR
jgi:isopenicillin-N N-acyltransferase like protein